MCLVPYRSFQSTSIIKPSSRDVSQDEADMLSCDLDSDSDISLLDHHPVKKGSHLNDTNDAAISHDVIQAQTDLFPKYGKYCLRKCSKKIIEAK